MHKLLGFQLIYQNSKSYCTHSTIWFPKSHGIRFIVGNTISSDKIQVQLLTTLKKERKQVHKSENIQKIPTNSTFH
jgi:hypothetical protein